MAALLSEETEGKEVSPSGRRGLHRLPLLAAPRFTIPQLAENVCIAVQNLQKMLFSGGKRTIIKVVLIITTGVFRRKQPED